MLLMTVRSSGNIIRLIFTLLILTGISGSAYSQRNLSGNIKNLGATFKPNPHTNVTAIPDANKMTVGNPAGFAAGDTVLVIQMQGVGIYTPFSYGEWALQYGEPGLYEFLIISGVSGSDISFKNNLKHTYDTRGKIQLIRVPYFSKATVTGKLECDPWDPVAKSGGVLAMIVGNSLTLQANIDVSRSGFRGGNAIIGDSICQGTNSSYQSFYYPASYTNAGSKGEGIANYDETGVLLFPGHEKGKGKLFSGGGGGNGNHSGGGGGSHRGIGGTGGYEKDGCFPSPSPGGIGGKAVQSAASLANRIFMGGGGGASSGSATGITGPGGNGGGIVIIVANSIIGNGGEILANGGDGGNGGGAGAGGGGAGGTIALSVLNYSGTINANVNGGKGGDNIDKVYGEGAGGGAGLVWLTLDNALIVPGLDGGIAGTSDNIKAGDGGTGNKLTGFDPTLNGFLFNSIRSSVTENEIDSTCYNMPQTKILGTSPVGGTGPYTYKWEVSSDKNFASSFVLTNDADPKNYTPKLADNLVTDDTVYFRRTITDSSTPIALIDKSLPFKVKVQPNIKNNAVGPPDTICYAQNPPTIRSVLKLKDGNNFYTYNWMVSTDGASSGFGVPANLHADSTYTPLPAIKDTWYRRTVTSGRCIDSSGVVKMRVLNNIGGNAITSALAEEICNGMNFSPVTATITPALTGGDASYKYEWISSANSWGAAPDIYTNPGYSPVAGSFALGTQVSLRRVVFSGTHDVCKDTTTITTSVKLTRWPVIINNSVTADQTIGYDSIPQLLKENPAPGMTGGSGTYIYQWQKDTLSWTPAPGTFNLTSYQPPALKITNRFRRFVTSSACTSTSNTITITVHQKITNTIALANGANDTIATSTGPGQLTGSLPTGGSGVPGDYSYKWYRSTTGTFGAGDIIAGATSQSYDPGVLTAAGSIVNYYFRRDVSSPVVSPTSTYKSNIIKVVVLPVLAAYNINGSIPKCSGFRPDWLKGSTPVTGGDNKYKYTWQDSTSGGVFIDIPGRILCDSANYKPPALTATTSYRRIVYSTANNFTLQNAVSNSVKVIINQIPTGSLTTVSDTSICGGTAAKVMISLTGATKFRVTMKENTADLPEITNISGPNYTFSITKTPAAVSEVYTYALSKVVDQNQCQTTTFPAQSRKVTVFKQPTPQAGTDILHNCGPTATLNASPAVGTGSWLTTFKKTSASPGAGSVSFASPGNNVTNVTIGMNTASGFDFDTYRFYWTEINGVCSGMDSVNVTFDKNIIPVVFNPSVKISNSEDQKEPLPPYNPEVGKGIWESQGSSVLDSLPDSNPKVYIAKELKDGDNIYLYIVTNGLCSESGQYTISYQDIKIPQGISPNGDNVNDKLVIENLDFSHFFYTLRIINSAGSEVFYTDSDNWTVWDGKSNGMDLPEGTYYYLLTLQSNWDSTVTGQRKGFVVLKRNKY
jgi:gliding motility-associated-like protein